MWDWEPRFFLTRWKSNHHYKKRCYIFIFLVTSFLNISPTISSIDHLKGEAGFRMANLQWKYSPVLEKKPTSFKIRYCEQHPWGLHRCRYQIVETNSTRNGRWEKFGSAESNEVFVIDIGGLRMATNYSFQVIPQEIGNKNNGKPSQISLQTKGFSAKATKCLADSSEVLVETGPFFGGRISVEESEVPGCFIRGDPESPQTKYTLKIRHDHCGSVVNGSKVTSVILVQENIPILTHSTRKFVVVCSFSPESFIVKAGVSLPREGNIAKAIDFAGLIRVSPQGTILLVANKEIGGSRGRSSVGQVGALTNQSFDKHMKTTSQIKPPEAEENENSIHKEFQENEGKKEIEEFSSTEKSIDLLASSRRQSRAYLHHHPNSNMKSFNDESRFGNPVAAGRKLEGRSSSGKNDTLEGLLVLGMICIVMVGSISAIAWFIKSYSITSGESRGQEQLNEFDSSSSTTSGDTSSPPPSLCSYGDTSDRIPHNLDTKSELEVELDFEFSEETNGCIIGNPSGGIGEPNSNILKNYQINLENSWNMHPSASQA